MTIYRATLNRGMVIANKPPEIGFCDMILEILYFKVKLKVVQGIIFYPLYTVYTVQTILKIIGLLLFFIYSFIIIFLHFFLIKPSIEHKLSIYFL